MKKDSWGSDASCSAPMMGAKTSTRGVADAPHIKMTQGTAVKTGAPKIGKDKY